MDKIQLYYDSLIFMSTQTCAYSIHCMEGYSHVVDISALRNFPKISNFNNATKR